MERRAYKDLRGWIDLNGSALEYLSIFHFISFFTTFYSKKRVLYVFL
jgi:hypothetical protein